MFLYTTGNNYFSRFMFLYCLLFWINFIHTYMFDFIHSLFHCFLMFIGRNLFSIHSLVWRKPPVTAAYMIILNLFLILSVVSLIIGGHNPLQFPIFSFKQYLSPYYPIQSISWHSCPRDRQGGLFLLAPIEVVSITFSK